MNFDVNKLHLQPKPVQYALALVPTVALVVAGFFVLYQDQWTEFTDAQAKEEELKSEYTEKSIRAASLDNLKLELQQIEASTQLLLKQLPTSAEIPTLIQELHQAAAKNGLTMNAVTPEPKMIEGPIERLPFSISVTGDYDQIAQFTRDVGKMSRIVTLANISITHGENENKGKLVFTAMANTYKALDIAEIASDASAAPAPAAQ